MLKISEKRKWDNENGFYLTSEISRIGKLIAQYELYKSIISLPGELIEFGVYKGTSLIRWSTFRELLESQNSRKIIGFDTFGEFPVSGDLEDIKFIKQFEEAGGNSIKIQKLKDILTNKHIFNYELIKGDVFDTLPNFIRTHPALKIALLHLDMDVYEPTKYVLEELFQRVVKDGLIVIDDYSTVSGATKAIDEFIAYNNVSLEKLKVNYIPTFFRKI